MSSADASTPSDPHDWNAGAYDATNAGIIALGKSVLYRLPLVGDETVLDAGCGTGVLTEHLSARVPDGRVIALDAAPSMVDRARERFAGRREIDVIQADLRDFDLGDRKVDAIFSTATFHWIADHERLWRNLRAVLVDGGRMVAQCGGVGNIAAEHDAYNEVGRNAPYDEFVGGWDPVHFAEPGATAESLLSAGFTSADCSLEETPVTPADKGKHLREIILGSHLEKLPVKLREPFARDVESLLPDTPRVGYVRLNINAIA